MKRVESPTMETSQNYIGSGKTQMYIDIGLTVAKGAAMGAIEEYLRQRGELKDSKPAQSPFWKKAFWKNELEMIRKSNLNEIALKATLGAVLAFSDEARRHDLSNNQNRKSAPFYPNFATNPKVA